MGEEEVRMRPRKEKKKDGSNWVMFAGGAIAVAAGAAFGRRKILEDGKKSVSVTASESRLTVKADDENGSTEVEPIESIPNETLEWSNSQLALPSTEATFQFRSFKPKRPASTDPSPPRTKFIRQSSATPESSTESEVSQADLQMSQSAQRRSEVVSRLRQQIRSRDSVICEMQSQLADQDQMIAMHRNHCVDLQECVQEISAKLYEAKLEIQRLQRELMKHNSKPVVDLDEEYIDYAISEIKRQWVHPEDVEDIIMGARKLNEEVEHMRREREAKEIAVKSKARQCDLLSRRLSALTTELEEVKSAADGKQRLLDAKEQEYLKLTNVVQDLQRRLEIEARGKESQERSMSTKSIMKRDTQLAHNMYRHTREEVPFTFAYDSGGNGRKLHGSVPVRYEDYGESASRGEPRCLFEGYTKKREAPGNHEEELESDVMIDESLIRKFGYDLDQLACALSVTSNAVLEKAQHANVEQRDIETVTRELTRHQARLAELKSRMANFTAQTTEDDGFSREGSSFVHDLERKLSCQEKIAKETFSVIQQLASSKHLTSHSNTPVQVWRTVQETPRRRSSHNIHQEHAVVGSSNESSRNALHDEVSPHFWERQGLPGSAFRNFNQNRNNQGERQTSSPVNLPYEFQVGALESAPASASRPRSRRQSPCVEQQLSPDTTSGFSFGHYTEDRMSSPEPESKFPSFNPSPEPGCITLGLSKRVRPNYSGSECSPSPGFTSLVTSPDLAQFGSPWFKNEASSRLQRPLFTSPALGLDHTSRTQSLTGGRSSSECDQDIGVSPFAARMARLKVEKEPEGDSVEERRLFSKDVEALCQRIGNLDALEGGRSMVRESRDSSGSWYPDAAPVAVLPSVLRRSSESSNRHR